MSFELLDVVNDLIIEDLLESSAEEIVNTTLPEKLPSDKVAGQLLSFTQNALQNFRNKRLSEIRDKFEAHKKEPLYTKAIQRLPSSVEEIFSQIVKVVTTQGDVVPESWTYANRSEKTGKDIDEEIKKIWVRMYMLGLIDNSAVES